MIEQISRSYLGEVTEVKPEKRSVVARVGTGDLDRFLTVIDPMGMDLTAFRTNPVVLWEHGKDPVRGRMPIGRCTWIKTRKRGHGELLAETEFAPDDYSQGLYEMYRDGFLQGWSIHALPDAQRCSPPTKEERRARPELDRCQTMYRGTELTEYSGTAVPGQAKALTMMQERGIWVSEEARAAVETDRGGKKVVANGDCYEGRGADDDDLTDDERKRIRRDGDDWVATDDDGTESRHASEAEARECLAGRGKPRSVEHRVVDVAGIHRHYLELIERHYAAQREMVKAQLDLMRGRV